MKISNLSLAAKLWMAMVIVVGLLTITLTVATARGSALSARLDAISAAQAEKIAKVTLWVGLIETNVTRVTAGVISSDPAVEELYKDLIPATINQISEIQKSIDGMDLDPEGKTVFARIGDERKVVLASLTKAREAKKAGDQAAAVQEIKTVFLPATDKYVKSLQQFSESQAKGFQTMQQSFAQMRQDAGRFAQVMVLLLILILIGGTVVLIGQIRQPLRDAISVADASAGGEVSAKVDVSRGDEFGEMMKAIAHMQSQLLRLVSDVRRGTDNMATASEEIAIGNQDLADRTEQTASNLEKTASSMEELTATVKQSTDSARQADQLAASAAQVAQRGGQVVSQVVATMEDINTSSRKISDIISVIDGIAFQTNILALNAAVEAARAGEQGRGFAVVASEVRSLAGRSADAAKEIKQLISASVEKVEGGSTLVAQAGQTMSEIVNSVQRVTDIMGEITAATNEQAQGIAEVNTAVNELDQMTQQNAALVEQSAAAASSLKDQARSLAEVVGAFKLDGQTLATFGQQRAAPRLAPKPAAKAAPRPAASALARPKPAGKPLPPVQTKLAAKPAKPTPAGGDEDWETF